MKSYQFKTTIGSCMDILLKELNILTAHKRDFGVANIYEAKITKPLNKMQLRKW